jgi:hypothetical protein
MPEAVALYDMLKRLPWEGQIVKQLLIPALILLIPLTIFAGETLFTSGPQTFAGQRLLPGT